MIKLYCVGIHFNKLIEFAPDMTGPSKQFMSGKALLNAAAAMGLRYKLTPPPPFYPLEGHLSYVGYTPQPGDNVRVTTGTNFPFFGQPLSLTEILAPLGQPSVVLQYTVQALDPFNNPTPMTAKNLGPADPNNPNPFKQTGDAQFGLNGFPDECEIRVRLLSIYCAT